MVSGGIGDLDLGMAGSGILGGIPECPIVSIKIVPSTKIVPQIFENSKITAISG